MSLFLLNCLSSLLLLMDDPSAVHHRLLPLESIGVLQHSLSHKKKPNGYYWERNQKSVSASFVEHGATHKNRSSVLPAAHRKDVFQDKKWLMRAVYRILNQHPESSHLC